jgi:hypothetical protein
MVHLYEIRLLITGQESTVSTVTLPVSTSAVALGFGLIVNAVTVTQATGADWIRLWTFHSGAIRLITLVTAAC